MIVNAVTNEVTEEEEFALGVDFSEVQPVEAGLMSAADLEDDSPKETVPEEPDMSSPEWSTFVMSQFQENELDDNGRPLVRGLRRVARRLLGPILKSQSRVVQAPSLIPSFEKLGILQPAVVEHTVVILMTRLEQGMSQAYETHYTDAADCYFGSAEPEFARYLTAMASTRAEGRSLRKALQLSVIASEEASSYPALEAATNGMITPEQVNFINILCSAKRCNIDVMKFINSGKKKYETVEDVNFGTAAKIVEVLSGYQNNPKSIPDAVRGYDPNWRSK